MKYAQIRNAKDGANHVQIDVVGCKAGDLVHVVYEHSGIARTDVGLVEQVLDENPYGSDHRCGYAVAIVPPVPNPARELKKARKKAAKAAEAAENAAALAEAVERRRELDELAEVAQRDETVARLLVKQAELESGDRQLKQAAADIKAGWVARKAESEEDGDEL